MLIKDKNNDCANKIKEELAKMQPAGISKLKLKDSYSMIKENLPFLRKIDPKFLDLHNILSFMLEHCESFLFWFK